LKMIRKTREEYLNETRPQAEQRIKRQLVLDAVAKEENIAATPEEVEALFQLYAQMGQELPHSDAQIRALTASYQREKAISRLIELTTDPDPDEEIEEEVAEEASVANAEAAALAAEDLTDESAVSGEAQSEHGQADESVSATTLSTEPMTETTA